MLRLSRATCGARCWSGCVRSNCPPARAQEAPLPDSDQLKGATRLAASGTRPARGPLTGRVRSTHVGADAQGVGASLHQRDAAHYLSRIMALAGSALRLGTAAFGTRTVPCWRSNHE